ncbi:MAG: copper resistance protein B [Rhodospirillaceae bacterium]|jgi:copper resistance protein B|nr:copper resistance protein B [Rhodospirillaceae bacterium]
MRSIYIGLMAFAVTILAASPLFAEQLIWGIQAEQLEYRIGNDTDVMAWDVDALVGTDELKLVFRSEGEFETNGDTLEAMENQLRLQAPISTFFDAVGGVRVDTPEGPDRVYGVVGVHGLAPQWFEIDADLFVSDRPSFRFEAEYEALITNRLILTPSIEFNLPFTDDLAIEQGAWGPKLEVGARLSYDLVDRAISPYIGIHYERVFGETEDIATSEGKDADALFLTIGTKLFF